MQADRVEQTAQAQDHVAPALAAGRPMIELAEPAPEPGLLRLVPRDARLGQQIEDTEFLFPQPLVGDETTRPARHSGCARDQFGGLARPSIGRDQHHLRLCGRRERAEPSAERPRLFAPEIAERHVRVAQIEAQRRQSRLRRLRAGEIADALPVTDHPKPIRPALLHSARSPSRSLLGTPGIPQRLPRPGRARRGLPIRPWDSPPRADANGSPELMLIPGQARRISPTRAAAGQGCHISQARLPGRAMRLIWRRGGVR